MKPLKILLFIAAVFSLLFIISFVFPEDGISLGKDLHLKFIHSADLFEKDSVFSEYTDSLIQHAVVTEDPESEYLDTMFFIADSLAEDVPDINLDSIIQARIDSISKTVYPIEFAIGAKSDLHGFFEIAEESGKNKELIRILHYGDSQIENDRMTSLLRYRFQKVFGGSGCGMVPAIPLYFGNPTFKESYEGEWLRFTGFGRRDSMLEHDCFGMLACFTRIPKAAVEELPSLEFQFLKGRRASKFSKLRIFMHSVSDSSAIIIQMNDTICDTISNIGAGFQTLCYKPEVKASKVKILFDMEKGGRIYGISFDPEAGVQMDNIAMRGSSGLEFSNSDSLTMANMIDELNPGLVIMQFGGNVVPYIKSTSYYKRSFIRELSYLKKLLPDVAIVVIGPADMSTKEDGKFVTYPTLEPVRDALKEAALESGCGFWDMFEAMGGENSIQNFVLADPPLATADYIHFTPKGANLVAGMFFDALILEYSKYKAAKSKITAQNE